MSKRIILLCACCFLLSLNSSVHAAMPTAQFLLVGQGARAESLGQAVVADCFDYTATYWNPAAIAFFDKVELGSDYTELYKKADGGGIKNSFVSLAFPWKKWGFGIRYISESSAGIKTYDTLGQSTGTQGAGNKNINALLAYRLSEVLAFGIGAGTTNMTLADKSAQAINVNTGLIFHGDRLNSGINVSNFGTKLKFSSDSSAEAQPLIVRAGLSYKLLADKSLSLTGSYDKIMAQDKAGGIGIGCEYLPLKYLSLRTGIRKQNDSTLRTSFGLGLSLGFFKIDYAFTMAPQELLDTETHRIGISFEFKPNMNFNKLLKDSEPFDISEPDDSDTTDDAVDSVAPDESDDSVATDDSDTTDNTDDTNNPNDPFAE